VNPHLKVAMKNGQDSVDWK